MSVSFSNRLLVWYDREGRRDFPWQIDKTPYRIWVSEIMLQQTQAQTVIPYFESFIARFPTMSTLAAASIDEVLKLWAGLGYYARARNLHLAARQICERFDCKIPSRYELLTELPGIGSSTAGAILALGFGRSFPILDGNVKRVLTRHNDIEGWPGRACVAKQLWSLSRELLPRKRIADYTQAIMDLGATVCTRGQPLCSVCPVSSDCKAKIEGCIADRPTPAPRRHKSTRSVQMLVVTCNDEVLLQRRPAGGIWGGLLSLPEVGYSSDAATWCQRRFGVCAKIHRWEKFVHKFTHFSLSIYPVNIHLQNMPRRIMEGDSSVWYKIIEAGQAGVPAPVKALLEKLASKQAGEE